MQPLKICHSHGIGIASLLDILYLFSVKVLYISRPRLVSNKSCACQLQINVDHAPPAFPVSFDF